MLDEVYIGDISVCVCMCVDVCLLQTTHVVCVCVLCWPRACLEFGLFQFFTRQKKKFKK